MTTYITSSFVKYSHTPSDAITMNLSVGYVVNSSISGSAITPAYAPILSPIDLVIANPGASTYCSQTLSGPTLFP